MLQSNGKFVLNHISEISVKCVEKHEELVCFKCFVWTAWWWLLRSRNT